MQNEFLKKLKELNAKISEELAKDAEKRDGEKLADLYGQHAKLLDSEDAKAFPQYKALGDQLAALKDVTDKQAEVIRDIQKAGLGTQNSRLVVAGKDARLQMLADKRAFLDDNMAKEFGALAVCAVLGQSNVDAKTLDIFKSVCKAIDIDPTASGSGLELVSNEYKRELIRNVEAVGEVFTKMRRVPLGTHGTTTWPKRTGGLTARPTAVGAQIAQSGAAFETVTMSPVKWATLTGIPNEMFRDPGQLIEIGQFVGIEIVYAIAYALDNACLNGDGSADYGTITGIFQSATIAAVAAVATHTTMAAIDAADIGNVIAGLTKAYALKRAEWVMSLSVKGKLRNLKDTNGNPIYDRGSIGREPSSIDGYPYNLNQLAPAAAAVSAGTLYGAFGDLKLSHYFGIIGNIRIDKSTDFGFANDVTFIRGIAEADCVEVDSNAIVTAATAAE